MPGSGGPTCPAQIHEHTGTQPLRHTGLPLRTKKASSGRRSSAMSGHYLPGAAWYLARRRS